MIVEFFFASLPIFGCFIFSGEAGIWNALCEHCAKSVEGVAAAVAVVCSREAHMTTWTIVRAQTADCENIDGHP